MNVFQLFYKKVNIVHYFFNLLYFYSIKKINLKIRFKYVLIHYLYNKKGFKNMPNKKEPNKKETTVKAVVKKPIKKLETKSEAFLRIAQPRVISVQRALRILGNCSNRTNYEYTSEQVDSMFDSISESYSNALAKYSKSKAEQESFKF